MRAFWEKHQCLPVPGKVPDMKAQSSVYIQLQNIYKAKARLDVAEVLETVRSSPGGGGIEPTEVELFCKNAAFVKLVNATETGPRADRLASVVGKSHGTHPCPCCFCPGRVTAARHRDLEGAIY